MMRQILLLCLLPLLCALPCCKTKKTGQEPPGTEAGKASLVKQPRPADRKFLNVLEKLPRSEEEKKVERWTSLGISVESGWVVDMSPEELVIEHTDITKKELAQHYLDKLAKSGWKQASFEDGEGSFVHELTRDDLTLTVTGRDRKEGGATVTLGLAPSGGKN
ncbi:MAG: hypothetical protein JRG91_15455 [Deltaproteobacteria bacterium]|nr:hypothetical protein [Deltaproteobacteria bacterium]